MMANVRVERRAPPFIAELRPLPGVRANAGLGRRKHSTTNRLRQTNRREHRLQIQVILTRFVNHSDELVNLRLVVGN